MYRLYLLRHADAAWARPGTADLDRPLSPHGRKVASALGQRMRAEGHVPAFVLCSPAKRARETWEALAPGLAAPAVETLHMPELYRGGPSDYLTLISTAPTEGPLLVVGHNPMMSELAKRLAGEDESASPLMPASFPPGGLAVIAFEKPLSAIGWGKGVLAAFLPPTG